jgi:hypothetical protein
MCTVTAAPGGACGVPRPRVAAYVAGMGPKDGPSAPPSVLVWLSSLARRLGLHPMPTNDRTRLTESGGSRVIHQ